MARQAASQASPDEWRRARCLAMIGTVLLGALCLPMPYSGDQALFSIGARAVADGAVLYRDFWDFKQPGIYLYHLVTGAVFRRSELASNLVQLVVMCGLGLFLAAELRQHVRRAWVAGAAPFVVVGLYYAGARPTHLGQVEILVGPLLFVALVAASRAERADAMRRHLVVVGLAAGAVFVLKHFYALIPMLWLLRTLKRRVDNGESLAELARALLWVAAGFAAVTLPMLVYFAGHGQLGRIWWTWFEYAPDTTSVETRPLERLVRSVGKTVAIWAVVYALAALALLRRDRWRDRFTTDLLVWIAVAVPLVLVQSWWEYHQQLHLLPAAVLAVLGLDDWVGRTHGRPLAVRVAPLALLVIPLLLVVARKADAVVTNDFGLTVEGRRGIREQLEPTYAAARRELGRPGTGSGSLYVVGNPIFQLVSGRPQALPMQSWSPELHNEDAWEEIVEDLESRVPTLVFIEVESAPHVERLAPEFLDLLDDRYRVLAKSGEGTWYRLRG